MGQFQFATFLVICFGLLINGDWSRGFAFVDMGVKSLFSPETWFWIVVATEALLAIANFIIALSLRWIYHRSPEIRRFWGPAGSLSMVFALLFGLKGISRCLTTVALFDKRLWNIVAVCDTTIGFMAWIAAVSLLWAIHYPGGIKRLLRDREAS